MYRIAALVLVVSSSVFAQADERGLDLQGSLYGDFSAVHWVNPTTKDSANFLGENVFKFNFSNRNKDFAKVDGAFELKMPYGYQPLALAAPGDFLLLSADNAALLLDVRRLYLEMYFNKVELSVGRKLINFGEGRIFSPLNKFSVIDASDYTFRRNSADVAMAQVNFNYFWRLDIIAELPYDTREHTTALKGSGTIQNFDLGVVGMFRHNAEQGIVGATFKGDAFLGLYGEALYTFPTKTLQGFGDAMLGIDYSVANKWLFVGEYQYQGHPTDSTWDNHSMLLMASYTINELMSASASAIHNFTENNSIVTGYWNYNILQNADLVTYIQWYNNDPYGMQANGFDPMDLRYAVRFEVKF